MKQTMMKFAESQEDSADAINKLVNFRAGKLAEWFNKPVENFTETVR